MWFVYEPALGWQTLTSKNADCSLAQKPRVRGLVGSTSPVTSWRTGFTSTSVHTACRISASRSRISLCRGMIYPPRIQIKAWPASNKSPQTHNFGMTLNSQPYLNLIIIASLNSLLLRVKFISFKGITLSQLEAPFPFINSTARWDFKGKDIVTYLRSRLALSGTLP